MFKLSIWISMLTIIHARRASPILTRVRRPWRQDPQCKRFNVTFVKEGERAPKVALATYPGSGNTWMRHLIEGLTGIFTGDVYRDVALSKTFYGSLISIHTRRTFVFKTHKLGWRYKTAVTIVRNPLTTCRAHYNYRGTHSHRNSVDLRSWTQLKMLEAFCKRTMTSHLRGLK